MNKERPISYQQVLAADRERLRQIEERRLRLAKLQSNAESRIRAMLNEIQRLKE